MTYPVGGAPDGAYKIGDVRDAQELDEPSVKSIIRAKNLSPWSGAQDNLHSEFISAPLFGGEVARLDNRIDELVIGTERAIRYTYSESDVWEKHPAGYKVVVDVMSGATPGTQPSGAPGVGGYAGGWHHVEFTGADLENLPQAVAITIGAGASPGGTPGVSSFGSFVTAGAATADNYGTGNRTYKMRGGNGGGEAAAGTAGSDGPLAQLPGGSGGARADGFGGNAQSGGHGYSITEGMLATGSAGGGGGGGWGAISRGGNGGHGGWPSAPGGGRGRGQAGSGTSGNGAFGAVFVTVYVEDKLGVPPSTPANLVAASVSSFAARVTWDAATDDVMVKNYVLYLNGTRYAVVTSTFHDFVALTPSTSYTVRVQAVDIGDNPSEMSAPLTFTTLAS